MQRIIPTSCRKCGGHTRIYWDEGEKSSGMDIRPLRSSGMRQTCIDCGFTETVNDLENRKEAENLINGHLQGEGK